MSCSQTRLGVDRQSRLAVARAYYRVIHVDIRETNVNINVTDLQSSSPGSDIWKLNGFKLS